MDLLKDSDPYIRAFMVRALAYLGDQSALETLKQLSQNNPNSKVRSRAKWAYEHLSGGKLPKKDFEED